RCAACHKSVRHRSQVAARACVGCHMPQVPSSAQLKFTNHWIGVYTKDSVLLPSLRAVRRLRPVPVAAPLTTEPPAHPSALLPLFDQALATSAKQFGPRHAKTARSAADLGLFLISIEQPVAAEKPLRQALAIDFANKDPMLATTQESLG